MAAATTGPASPRTLFDRVWDAHVVRQQTSSTPAVLYVDLHLVHEVTSAQAFAELRDRGLGVWCPDRTIATMDHATPTAPRDTSRRTLAQLPAVTAPARAQLEQLERNCAEFGIRLFALGDERQGIVHVIGPELGLTQPGMTVVCGDSHTSTHGAFGALAFGIGTSQVAHVLATQCVLQSRPRTMEVRVDGRVPAGVTAKDIILAIIAKIGIGGGTGHVIEYTGSAITALSMEERMTDCNMSIEAGARAGMIAPDDTTIEYLAGRPFAPRERQWEEAAREWRTLATDGEARFDRAITIDAGALAPMITYGTNPGMGMPITDRLPEPGRVDDPSERDALVHAFRYMGLTPGQPLLGTPVDIVFIGSCTNSRLSDLRAAASVIRGRRVANGVRMLVVPGSQAVKRAAEAESLDRVFRDAGAEWREAGCSMCIAMNGDQLRPGQLAISTSNRNFEGRQGPGGRTLLASPLTAAAAAIRGVVTDPRTILAER
jgi:3-isopropylmalate/(R)-2-methylmalate dehydratase large subunit